MYSVFSGVMAAVFGGPEIVLSERLAAVEKTITEQVCFPRSTRRRIVKKWAKNPKNYLTRTIQVSPEQGPYRIGNRIICGPKAYAKLIAAIK